jgi:hypothetical protein
MVVLFLEKKSRFILLFLLTSLMILEIFTVMVPDDQLSPNAAVYRESAASNIIDIKESDVVNKFDEIKKIPYNEHSLNCKNKSEMFADYLKSNGATEIYIVMVPHSSGSYSHEFVEWKGHYYDTCSSSNSYEMSKEKYLKKLAIIGFTGIVVTSPYT